jgi:hypothetical protein
MMAHHGTWQAPVLAIAIDLGRACNSPHLLSKRRSPICNLLILQWDMAATTSARGDRVLSMKLLDLSDARGRPITQHGGQFTLVPIMGVHEQARTVLIHLGPGDSIGEHPTESRQLIMVVRGIGWVSGEEGVRESIGPDSAAFFEEGEIHASGTNGGMTMVVVEGDFTPPGIQ